MSSIESHPPTVVVTIPFSTGDDAALRHTLRGLAERSMSGRVRVAIAAADEAARQAACAAVESSSAGLPAAVDDATGASLAAALRRASRDGADDVVLLAPGVEVPYAWDLRLAKAAHAEPQIAAAVPVCDASPLHRVIAEDNAQRARGQAASIDRTVYAMGQRSYYEVPTLHPYCAYLRGDALQALQAGLAEAGRDAGAFLDRLASAWRSLGRVCVLCDFVYVAAPASADAVPAAHPSVERSAFELHHPLGALRRAVNEALERGLPPVSTPALDDKPVVLHVMHFWGGGVDKWVRDFARADEARTNLLLATYRIGESGGQRVVLYADADAKSPLHTWDIARPLLSTAVSSLEYRDILQQIVAEFDVEAIVVSSLIGHSLETLTQPVRTLVVAHDFYPVCPNINPRFDEICASCGVDDMARCLRLSDFRDVFGDRTPGEWQALRDAYVESLLRGQVQMVVPTQSVASALKRIDSRLAAVPMRVIGHGIRFAPAKVAVPAVEPQRPLRLAVLGRLNAYKGSSLLRSAAPLLASIAEVHLVGCGRQAMALARELGWNAIEEYDLDELPGLLESIAPHAALLPSVVPETFSYTLSELWALGIPPIATALGAFAERIHDGVDGFLFEPRAEALLQLLSDLRSRPERLAAVASGLAARGPERTTHDMVADYAPMLPQGRRAVARFRIGIGRETALTEPYRQLNEAYAALSAAYAELSAAYGDVSAAYASTQDSYEHTRSEFDRVHGCYELAQAQLDRFKATYEAYDRELRGLRLGLQWWLAPKAERLLHELHRKIMDSPAPPGAEKAET